MTLIYVRHTLQEWPPLLPLQGQVFRLMILSRWLTEQVIIPFDDFITNWSIILLLAGLFLILHRLWTTIVICSWHLWSAIWDYAIPIWLQYRMNCTSKWRRNITMLPPSSPIALCYFSSFFRLRFSKTTTFRGGTWWLQGLGPSSTVVFFKFNVETLYYKRS